MKKQISLGTLGTYLPILAFLSLFILLFASYRSCSRLDNFSLVSGESSQLQPRTPLESGSGSIGIVTISLNQAPRHVRQMIEHLRRVRHFTPPRGYRGGRVFRNREGKLPRDKNYFEYDVHPATPGVSRGTERLVID